MWVGAYVLFSIYIDLMFATFPLWSVEITGWLFYTRHGLKVVLLVVLVWRFSSKTWEAWVVAVMLIASMPLVSVVCRSFDVSGTTPEQELSSAIWATRIFEIPVTLIYWVKFSAHDANWQVVPLPSLDTSKLASRTCTLVELCDSCDRACGLEDDATCSICLERIELNELVTQLTCKHFFHTHCVSEWELRCTTRHRGGSLCPMRCPLTEDDGASVA
eukprot:TRINITY_DN65844_c0_g1_i1.p1 TRINITY_DN65844_c0_g1~~TRINITY_DN65844_c0_g1_i1.p1  ORF type:complete len:217 (+),score=9.13 TRINITY_DN65844_c0_g1_i1:62-712(+)